jgi:transposase-like protein
VADRVEAVRSLLSGKASIEQLSQRYAVSHETIESWRAQGLDGLESAFQGGTSRSDKEKALEQQMAQMRAALTRAVMEKELLQQALDIERDKRPTVPRRSRG